MQRKHLSRMGVRDALPQWSGDEDVIEHGYPRPLLRRKEWWPLNGTWDFALDLDGEWRRPQDVAFDRPILVPFSPETTRSGVNDTGMYRACWYRRRVTIRDLVAGERVLLHFGAVDYLATVWVNGALVGRHEGGYSPFTFDITDVLDGQSSYELHVRAFDDPNDLAKPRGKQDWQLQPHAIWYPRTTGIWQTVWQEIVPHLYIQSVRWTPHLDRWELALSVHVAGSDTRSPRETTLALKLYGRGVLLVDDRYSVTNGEARRRISLPDPGIDDFRNELLWSPESPTLLDAELTLIDERNDTVDRCVSYTALRTFGVDRERLLLNGRPYLLRMVLDQGYWPDTGMTPPNDEALRRDVELTKALGFNGARKHQKVEDPRYLYWADRLGVLVWTEMPSAYRFTDASVSRLMRQWIEIVQRDVSHPCIVAWVPFNESWGVPNLPDMAEERHYVQALYYSTKTLDPSRPVVGNDGWESVTTDIVGIHDYDDRPETLLSRYKVAQSELGTLLKHERPGGRALALGGGIGTEHPVVLSEFGGIAFSDGPETWGYSRVDSAEHFAERYARLLQAVHALPLFSGFCYTQLYDTFQEANGLLYADRTPKVPMKAITEATLGPRAHRNLDPSRGPGVPREGDS